MRALSFAALIIFSISIASGQSTGFTYQGRLATGGAPAQGSFDFVFELYDQQTGGAKQGPTITREPLTVLNGGFSIQLDFGDVFSGGSRYLEISVRPAGVGSYETLAPRQQITSSPYAVRALNTDIATNATQLGGVSASDFVITTDPRMTDARPPTGGSDSYIQNTTTAQNMNFSILGDGRARIFDALEAFRINGNRILMSTSGPSPNLYLGPSAGPAVENGGGDNIFVGRFSGFQNAGGNANTFMGVNAGSNNSLGDTNAFFGYNSGLTTTTGDDNAFFGANAGRTNSQGTRNSNFGSSAGSQNATGANNSNFGYAAGFLNTGSNNSVFGSSAGISNITGTSNSFFGREAATSQASGNENSYFGASAGRNLTAGTRNSFFGFEAGLARNGTNLTMLGSQAQATVDDLSFATAIGAGATVATSNTIALGRPGGQDTVQIPGPVQSAGPVSANIINAVTQFNIGGSRILSVAGTDNTFAGLETGPSNSGSANSFFGRGAGQLNTSGTDNSFFGRASGINNQTGSENAFFGRSAGLANIDGSQNSFFGQFAGQGGNASGNTMIGYRAGQGNFSGNNNTAVGLNAGISNVGGSNNTFIGAGADGQAGSNNFATAIGAGAFVQTSNTISLGRSLDRTLVNGVLDVAGNAFFSGTVRIDDRLRLGLPGAPTTTGLCVDSNSEVVLCGSSLRFKENVSPYESGLDLIRKLRPVYFDWKHNGVRDFGLVAEEVAAVEPLLATTNRNGEIQGVSYDRIGVVLVNAVNEQQAQIEAQQKEIERLKHENALRQKELEELKAIVCSSKPKARVCRK